MFYYITIYLLTCPSYVQSTYVCWDALQIILLMSINIMRWCSVAYDKVQVEITRASTV